MQSAQLEFASVVALEYTVLRYQIEAWINPTVSTMMVQSSSGLRFTQEHHGQNASWIYPPSSY